MKNEKSLMKRIRKNKGITLIALVITIIVLLILAAVSIATLTGENGILSQANKAKVETRGASVEEECNLWKTNKKMDSQTAQGTAQTLEGLLESLEERNLITAKEKETIKETGEITIGSRTINFGKEDPPVETPSTVKEAIKTGHVYQASENREIQDEFGNKVVVPDGFKVVEGEDVTKGVVIEDAKYKDTKGSQFVWIPVGTVYTAEVQKEENAKTIKLNRYTFTDDGTETPHNQEPIDSYYQELKISDKENATAKTTVYNAFTVEQANGKTKVEEAGGYYIGRYEAREEGGTLDISKLTGNYKNIAPNENWTGYLGGTLVEKPNAQVFNYITQNKAAELCRSMYTSITFESDLMNSYAWDTAIVFLQAIDDRILEAKKTQYSQQNSLNTISDGIANQGTNKLTDSTKKDEICNIWDMASNCVEWTTETTSSSSNPCVIRGGYCNDSNYYTSNRDDDNLSLASAGLSFRPLLIV